MQGLPDLLGIPLEQLRALTRVGQPRPAGVGSVGGEPDVSNCSAFTNTALNLDGTLSFDPASGPKPVKYKSPF